MIARFEDRSPAITVNQFGKGTAIAVLTDARSTFLTIAQLTRDVLGYARSLRGASSLVDVVGTDETSDIAIAATTSGFRVTVVNHDARDMFVLLEPVKSNHDPGSWFDLANEKLIGASRRLRLTIPARGFRAVEFRRN